MERDLKTQNSWPLTAIYAGTFLIVAIVHWGVEDVFTATIQFGEQALLVGAITAFSGIFSNFMPDNLKHTLVYWRFRNVLSGHRCLRICENDPRLLSRDLERKWPILFQGEMKEGEQNAFWYKEIYRSVRNDPEVVQAHRSFLLYRDATAGLCLVLMSLVLWKAMGEVIPLPSLNIWSLAVLAGMIVMVSQASRQSGDRMVANAIVVALGDYETSETK